MLSILSFMRIAATAAQVLAVIFSIAYFRRFKVRNIPYFPFFLVFTILVELTGAFLADLKLNSMLYNFAGICFLFAMFYMYYHELFDKGKKNVVLVLASLYGLLSLINPFIENPMVQPMKWNALFGSFALIICIILYFIEFLKSDKVLEARSDLLFWISTGYLLYHVGYTPIRIARLTLIGSEFDFTSLFMVQILLVVLLNVLLIIGMIWSRKS